MGFLLITALAAAAGSPVSADDVGPPRLVVVISVDSLSPMQIARVEDLLTGGLARLLAEGACFARCYQDHAATLTGPGHFVLTSGRYPGPVGIIANSWWEPASGNWVYCVEDSLSELTGFPDADGNWGTTAGHHEPRAGSSYRNVGASTLGDWLRQQNPRSKVFAFARKDRAAVLLGGRFADGAYWYDTHTGAFVTSTFYQDRPHEWVARYNARRRADDFRNQRWERLLADVAIYETRARADSFPGEMDISSLDVEGRDDPPVFDHWVAGGEPVDDATYYDALATFPFADVMTMELVHEAITAEALGADENPDLLCIGLSVLDGVAHTTGPLSQESIDVVLRVDRLLGELFDHLDREIGSTYVVALSSDHGMLPLPEYTEAGHRDEIGGFASRRVVDESRRLRDELRASTAKLCGGETPVTAISSLGIWIDWSLVRRTGARVSAIDRAIRKAAAGASFVDRVYARRELLESLDETDPIVRRYRHSLHPSSSPDYIFCPVPGVLYSERGTTHGTPYDYDAHVPLMLSGPGVATGAFEEIVATVDLAPTLARLLRLQKLPAIDGHVLVDAIASTHPDP